MKKLILMFSVIALSMSCTNESDVDIEAKDGEKRSKLAAGSENEEALKGRAEERGKQKEKEEEERKENQTTMELSPATHDFGSIPKEEPVSTIFTVKNTGDKPLMIDDAKASCGCTVPRKPEEPIMPGEEGELEVTFTSKPNQAGSPITKTVTVTANIPGSTKRVNIKGKVEE
ncbi:MAG: DUF1573 domain-containing protein [Bacteroidota bacterium]